MSTKGVELPGLYVPISFDLSGLQKGLGDIKKQLAQLQDTIKGTGKGTEDAADRMGKALDNLNKRAAINELANSFKSMGAAVTGALSNIAGAAADFDQSMRNVNSIAKLSEKQFDSLKTAVQGVADDPSIRQGPKDLAKGLYDVYSSGFEGKKALDVLKVSAQGASAGMTDTATSGRALMAVLNSGIPGVSNAKQAMDVLFRTVDRGVVSFEQLASEVGALLPTASKAGITLQQLGAAIAVMTKSGQSAGEATNDLLNLITKIANPSKEAEKEFRRLGISFGFTGLQAKGLPGILKEIQDKTGGHGDAIKRLLPDMQAQRGALSLLKDAGADYRTELGAMTTASEGAGAMQKALAEQNKGAGAAADQAKKDIEGLKIELGNELLPTIRDGLKVIRDLVKAFRDLPSNVKSGLVNFGVGAAVFLTVAGNIMTLITRIGELKLALGALGLSGAGGAAKAALLSRMGPVGAAVAVAGLAVYGGVKGFTEGVAGENAKAATPAGSKDFARQASDARKQISVLQAYLATEKKQKGLVTPKNTLETEALKRAGLSFDPQSGAVSPGGKQQPVQREINRLSRYAKGYENAAATFKMLEDKRAKAGTPKPTPDPTPDPDPKQPPPPPDDDAQDKARRDAETRASAARQARETDAQIAVDKAVEEYRLALEALKKTVSVLSPEQLERALSDLVSLSQKITNRESELSKLRYTNANIERPLEKTANVAEFRQDTQSRIEGRTQRDSDVGGIRQKFGQSQAARNAKADQIGKEADAKREKELSSQFKAADDKFDEDMRKLQRKTDAELEMLRTVKKATLNQFDFERWEVDQMVQRYREAGASEIAIKRFVTAEKARIQREQDEDTRKRDEALLKDSKKTAKESATYTQQMYENVADEMGNVVGRSVEQWRGFKGVMQDITDSIRNMFATLVRDIVASWAKTQLLGGAQAGFSGANGIGGVLGSLFGLGPGGAPGTPPFMESARGNGGTGAVAAASAVGGKGGIMGLLGKGGLFGGSILQNIGWVGAGLAINRLLGNPLKKVGGLFKKLFRFDKGGILPTGVPSIVAEKGTGGEAIIPRTPSMAIPQKVMDQLRGGGGGNRISVQISGASLATEADWDRMGRRIAWQVSQGMVTARPEPVR